MSDLQTQTRLLEQCTDLKNLITGRLGAMQQQLDAIDEKGQRFSIGGGSHKSGISELVKGIVDNRGDLERNGRLRFESKSLLETKTVTSSGIIPSTPTAMFGDSGRPAYGGIRAALPTFPTDHGSVFRVIESAHTFAASPQTEASAKLESGTTLSGGEIPVQTIATWLGVTKQALDDAQGLEAFLSASLIWAVEKKTEEQLLSGDGTGQNLYGLLPTAAAFDPSILSAVAGYNKADILAAAGVQLVETGFTPSFYVVSPRDWFRLETLRGTDGHYILARPREAFQAVLWNRPVVPSPAMSDGYFVAVDASRNIIRQRQQMTVDVSFEHADFWVKNMVGIRVEERLSLVRMAAGSVIYGATVGSPS